MSPIRYWKPLALTLALGLGGLGIAHAKGYGDHCGGHDGEPGGRHLMHAITQLDDLKPEQRDALKALFERHREAAQSLRDAARDERDTLREVLDAGAADETVRPVAQRIGELMTQRVLLRAELRREAGAILTPEQLTQLNQMRDERRERFAERRDGDNEGRGPHRGERCDKGERGHDKGGDDDGWQPNGQW